LNDQGAISLGGDRLNTGEEFAVGFSEQTLLENELSSGEAELAKDAGLGAIREVFPRGLGGIHKGRADQLEVEDFVGRDSGIHFATTTANIHLEGFPTGDSGFGSKFSAHDWLAPIFEWNINGKLDGGFSAGRDQIFHTGGLGKQHAGIRGNSRRDFELLGKNLLEPVGGFHGLVHRVDEKNPSTPANHCCHQRRSTKDRQENRSLHRRLVLATEKLVGDGVKEVGFFSKRLKGLASRLGESSSLSAGFLDSKNSRIGRLAGGGIFAGTFAELLAGLGDVENVVNDLEGEAEGFPEFANRLDLGC
jgi:hypothetical protein